MSWLSSAFKRNRGWIGNALKNFAPVAGAFMGGLPGLLVGGLGSAAGRGVQKGANLGNILGQGASGAGMAYAGSKALGGLKSLFAPGSSAAGGTVAAGAPTAATPETVNIGGMVVKAPTAPALNIPTPPSIGARIGGAASSVGNFAKENPMAAAMGLQGVGAALGAPSEARYRDAQTRALESSTAFEEEERKRRKRLEESLEPLRQALAAQMNAGSQFPIARNPYSQ